MADDAALVYKLVTAGEWRAAEALGRFAGSAADTADGFIHLSTAAQVAETAARHFATVDDLLLVAVSTAALGSALRYEPSRGGALFPHLYGPLPMDAVRGVSAVGREPGGRHAFSPPLAPGS